MKLRAGDLVMTADILGLGDINLMSSNDPSDTHQVSMLKHGETAVVVSLSSHDARSAYIIGPHGAGWTFGAYLKRVQ